MVGCSTEGFQELVLSHIGQKSWRDDEFLHFRHVQHVGIVDETSDKVKHLNGVVRIEHMILQREAQFINMKSNFCGVSKLPLICRDHQSTQPIRHKPA